VTIVAIMGFRRGGAEVAGVRGEEETTVEHESTFIVLETSVNIPEYIRG
jgi:hypothetical protein